MLGAYFLEHNRYLNFVGILFIIAIAWFFSQHRSRINYRLVANALVFQCLIAFCALKTDAGLYVLESLSHGVEYLYLYARTGIAFLFGSLAQSTSTAWGTIFAVQVLPMIISFC